jgi:hypothetical protein
MITRLWTRQPRNCVSIPGRGQSFLSSPPTEYQHRRQSNLLFSGSGGFYPGVIRPVREAVHAPRLVPWKRITWAANPLSLYTFICQARGQTDHRIQWLTLWWTRWILHLLVTETCMLFLPDWKMPYMVDCVENSFFAILIVVPPCILISTNYFLQRMHCLLKHKILQFVFKCFT